MPLIWSDLQLYLDSEDIKQQNYTNINRLLAKVPGVYTREEDGFGLFPNLSIRGNLGTRSEKDHDYGGRHFDGSCALLFPWGLLLSECG